MLITSEDSTVPFQWLPKEGELVVACSGIFLPLDHNYECMQEETDCFH